MTLKRITKKGVCIAVSAVCALLILVTVAIYGFRSFRFYREDDGKCYFQLIDVGPRYSGVNITYAYHEPEWKSIFGFQCAFATGLISSKHEATLNFHARYTNPYGANGYDGKYQIFDISKLGNVVIPDDTKLEWLKYDTVTADIVMRCDTSESNAGVRRCELSVAPSKENKWWFDSFYETPGKYGNSAGASRDVRYTIEQNDAEYFVQKIYKEAGDKLPHTIVVFYRSKAYDCAMRCELNGIEKMPDTDWLTSFRYEPSFWEKLISE